MVISVLTCGLYSFLGDLFLYLKLHHKRKCLPQTLSLKSQREALCALMTKCFPFLSGSRVTLCLVADALSDCPVEARMRLIR